MIPNVAACSSNKNIYRFAQNKLHLVITCSEKSHIMFPIKHPNIDPFTCKLLNPPSFFFAFRNINFVPHLVRRDMSFYLTHRNVWPPPAWPTAPRPGNNHPADNTVFDGNKTPPAHMVSALPSSCVRLRAWCRVCYTRQTNIKLGHYDRELGAVKVLIGWYIFVFMLHQDIHKLDSPILKF